MRPDGAKFTMPAGAARAPLDPLQASAPGQVVWRFQTAAPIVAAPAVSARGDVYVASAEGYLHALDEEGRVRWSRAIDGSPIGEPALDPRGNVYVTTSSSIIALHADGRVSWQYFASSAIASAAVWGPPGQLYHTSADHCLHALSSAGHALWTRPLNQPLALAAFGLVGSEVALAEPAERAWPREHASPAHDPLRDDAVPPRTRPRRGTEEARTGQLWLIVGRELFGFAEQSDDAPSWHAPARYAAVAPSADTIASVLDRELVWRDARSGRERGRALLTDSASAAPALTGEGLAVVPLDSGDLALLALGGAAPQHIHVGGAPLWRPIWRQENRRVSVAAGSGSLVVIEIAAQIGSGGAPRQPPPEDGT
ncbi:MAG TPA: PQQ-binding-like beta-propeller repeat protein [Polyangiaceae bacterium]|nr:PQQ-binding-like beta-propeller repeat protein [Polyangiaceae bacterium]